VFANADRGIAGREIAVQRIDRQAEWLEITLGARLASFAAGVTPRQLTRIAHGEDEPDRDTEERLRNLFAVASYLAARDGGASDYSWLTEPNPELEGQTPAHMLHEGQPPEVVWLAAVPPF
jgi:Protein of unknown function (DUF2384)